MPAGRLFISDGTKTIDLRNLASGIGLGEDGWTPAVTPHTVTTQQSPLADMGQPVSRRFAVTTETFDVTIKGVTEDKLYVITQELERLLEKAVNYWVTDWQNEPVYLIARGNCETNTRYAIIFDYNIPQIDDPFSPDFLQVDGKIFDNMTVSVERGHWLSNPPGQGSCTEISNQYDWPYAGEWALNAATPAGQVRAIYQLANGTILFGDTPGIQYSLDDGVSWNAATIAAVTIFSFIQAANGDVFAGGAGNIYISVDDGVNWALNTALPAGNVLAMVKLENGYILATDDNGDVWRTTNGGGSWASVVTIPGSPVDIFVASDGTIYVVVDFVLYKSTDDGTTWELVTALAGGNNNRMLQDDRGDFYISTSNGVIKSSDGISWTMVLSGAGEVVDIIQASDGYLYVVSFTTGDVLVSRDYGASWDIILDSLTTPLVIFQAVNGSIFIGEDGQITWNDGTAVTVGAEPSCDDETFIVNGLSTANLTNIKIFDASGASYSDIFPAGAFPLFLLPNPPGDDDIVYFGIDDSIVTTGGVMGLAFDLSPMIQTVLGAAFFWEYWDGAAWSLLNEQDNTEQFGNAGPGSVNWLVPDDMTQVAVDGVTAYWVRARLDLTSGTIAQRPAQLSQDIYAITLPYVEFAAGAVKGDIAAIARIKALNQSDVPGASANGLFSNRLIAGLRTYERGPAFQNFINLSGQQMPYGIDLTLGSNTAYQDDPRAPTGQRAVYNPVTAEGMDTRVTIGLIGSVGRDFYGTFHVFLRVQRTAGAYGDFAVRLQIATGSGGVTFTTPSVEVPSAMAFQVLDFGQVAIPASRTLKPDEIGDITEIRIQASAPGTDPVYLYDLLELYLYDLVLVPVDEWAGDFVDRALEDDSAIGTTTNALVTQSFRKLLDIDSVSDFKNNARALVKLQGPNELVTSIYQAITPGEAILQANTRQRLWFVAMKARLEGAHTGADNASILTDGAVNFVQAGVVAGMTVVNVTDSESSAVITAVTETTITGTLAGGAGNDWDTGDEYYIICPNWTSPPEISHSILVTKNQRYLSVRGNR